MSQVTFVDLKTGERYCTDTDLNLIVAHIHVGAPDVRTKYVEVPGMDGVLDCSESLGCGIVYGTRMIEIDVGKTLVSRYAQDAVIKNAVHGKRMQIILSEDPAWCYVGRISVGEWMRECGIGHTTITCVCDPWKIKTNPTTVSCADLSTSYKQLHLTNERRPVVPTITVKQPTTLLWQGTTYQLNAGTHRVLGICLQAGDNTLKAKVPDSGTGSITVTYQEGSL